MTHVTFSDFKVRFIVELLEDAAYTKGRDYNEGLIYRGRLPVQDAYKNTNFWHAAQLITQLLEQVKHDAKIIEAQGAMVKQLTEELVQVASKPQQDAPVVETPSDPTKSPATLAAKVAKTSKKKSK